MALAVGSAGAKDIYVDNQAGNDFSSGRQTQTAPDQTGPVQTIARAVRLADRGDRIVLKKTDRPYRESITLAGSRCSGLPWQPFVIEGNGAILDGSAPVRGEAWRHFRGAVFRFQPSQMGYQQLFLNDQPAVRVIAGSPSHEVPDLQPRQWCSVGGLIYFCVDNMKLPGDYPLSCAHLQAGITLYRVEGVVIRDLVVQGFQIDGIALANSAREVSLVSVTGRGNGRCGISIGGASSADLNDCLVGDNGQAQLLTMPCSETHIHNSQLLSNTAPGWVDQGGRVYVGSRRVQGGLDEVNLANEQESIR